MVTQQIELQRSNVTPSQFLSYVKHQLKKRGMRDIASDLDLNYFRAGCDLNFDYRDEPGKPCKAEKTYVLGWDGSCYNEICEFDFDNEKIGHGYYYLLNRQ